MKKTAKKTKRALTAALAGVMMMSTVAAISASADDSTSIYENPNYDNINVVFADGDVYRDRVELYRKLYARRKEVVITNNGVYHAKNVKLYGRKVTNVDDDGNFVLGGWEPIVDTSIHGASNSRRFVIEGLYVQFAFSFDVTWGTDFPYSDVFWTDTYNTDWKKINIELGGFCRNANIKIDVDYKCVVNNKDCDSHTEWRP